MNAFIKILNFNVSHINPVKMEQNKNEGMRKIPAGSCYGRACISIFFSSWMKQCLLVWEQYSTPITSSPSSHKLHN
jgi:hypothetical protein